MARTTGPFRLKTGSLPLLATVLTLALSSHAVAATPPPAAPAHLQTQPVPAAPLSWAEQVEQLKAELRHDPDLSAAWVARVLDSASRNARVHRLMTPSSSSASYASTAPDWQEYRQRLVTQERINAGVQFWNQHRQTLQQASEATGVPAEVIVGIIGIETSYGRNTGNIRVLDALATLAFDYPQSHPRAAERADYFRRELGHFLRLSQQNRLDPLSLRGSFAGAMGIPQFMPSSWITYGVDFDRNGQTDLIGSTADAIGSVGNYLQAHGWKRGQPAWQAVSLEKVNATHLETLLQPDILPTFSAVQLRDMGVQTGADSRPLQPGTAGNAASTAGTPPGNLFALVKLRNGDRAPQYILGTENFYAITRYNQSSYYAMAVLELGASVARQATATR